MRKVDFAIIHCSDTPEGRNVKTSEIKRWHTEERGWSDIGYHYVVELDGTIVKGRLDEIVGAHAKGYNSNSIGICYVGGRSKKGLAKDTRTPEQKRSLYELIKILKVQHKGLKIIGHNEVSNKDCPSFDASIYNVVGNGEI